MKPYLKVSVAEVTEGDDGAVYQDFENHVHASISFDGKEEFNMDFAKLVHVDDEPRPIDIDRTKTQIVLYERRWKDRAAAIGVEFIFDRESVDEYFESFKETP